MTFAVVHLTDFHIRSNTDPILARTPLLVRAIASRTQTCSGILLAVSGDLSYSGVEDELLDAFSLVQNLQQLLTDATGADVYISAIPGNHDCDFSDPTTIRQTLLNAVDGSEEALQDDVLVAITQPLASFFEQRDAWCPPTVVDSPIAWHYNFGVRDKSILVMCLNTAWCSSRNEIQGSLFVPQSHFPAQPPGSHDLVIAMLHHPYNWMKSGNARLLTAHIERHADIVITGHEHVPDHRLISKITGERVQYIEGVALQASDTNSTGFNLITIDLAHRTQQLWTLLWDRDTNCYIPDTLSPPVTDMQVNRARKRKHFAFTKAFLSFLDDLGLQVQHPVAGTLIRSDVFTYPHLRKIQLRETASGNLIDAEAMPSHLADERIVLITGDDASGKTTLAKQLVVDLLASDVVPVYMSGRDRAHRTIQSPDDVVHAVSTIVSHQYGGTKVDAYHQLDVDQRAIVVDDYDKLSDGHIAVDDLISCLTDIFGRVYLFADAMSQELKSIDDGRRRILLEDREDAAHFRIQPLGFQRRAELVERWVALKDSHIDAAALVKEIEQRTRTINTVIGHNLIPSYPVYILGILQASDNVGPVDLRASINAHYYELFIKNALALTSDKIAYSIKTSFLARLAYEILRSQDMGISEERFRELYTTFTTRYELPITFEQLVKMLKDSRLLIGIQGRVEFRYDYCFYYFAALHITKNLQQDWAKKCIAHLADTIYEERNANIFLFLAHLSENSVILDEMLRCAREICKGSPVAALNRAELQFLEGDRSDLAKAEFRDVGDIRELRRRVLEQKDRELLDEVNTDEGSELEYGDEYAVGQEKIRELGAAFRTTQILGQVLKNFPASIDASRKREIARAAYEVALRALTEILTLLKGNYEPIVVDFMAQQMGGRWPGGYGEALRNAQRSVAGLTRLVSYSAVRRIVDALGDPNWIHPSPTIQRVADELDSPVSELTVFGMRLDYGDGFPKQHLRRIDDALEDNPIAHGVLQYLVIRHMHLFVMDYEERQSACGILGINYRNLRIKALDPRRKLIEKGKKKKSKKKRGKRKRKGKRRR